MKWYIHISVLIWYLQEVLIDMRYFENKNTNVARYIACKAKKVEQQMYQFSLNVSSGLFSQWNKYNSSLFAIY